MTPVVKICGLTDVRGLDAALEAGADLVGFVVFAHSPRHLALDEAAKLSLHAGHRARRVALTVDADDATLDALVSTVPLDMLQLHGRETPARVAAVRARYGLPVLRALPIGSAHDLAKVAAFDEIADLLLFDAPAGEARPGGNGRTFDWGLLRAVRTRAPWLLAGGLHDGNAAAALSTTGAAGVDVSSGVESSPGVKDPHRIAAFVAAVRNAAGTAPKVRAASCP